MKSLQIRIASVGDAECGQDVGDGWILYVKCECGHELRVNCWNAAAMCVCGRRYELPDQFLFEVPQQNGLSL